MGKVVIHVVDREVGIHVVGVEDFRRVFGYVYVTDVRYIYIYKIKKIKKIKKNPLQEGPVKDIGSAGGMQSYRGRCTKSMLTGG